ncbi:MAG TPA: hypothetical protein VMF58_05335 [Rhizomicrobium sp.]|nr:hypothetical protein [Rhizomicrobium sp.]
MTEVVLTLASGRQVAFDVACDLNGPMYFVFSVRKCGSSIFNDICRTIGESNRRQFVPVGDTFFWNNVEISEYVNDPALLDLLRPGNVYGGFRDMPRILLSSEIFRRSPKLLFVRDPRDALVSEFFSNAYSHPLPDENAGTTGMRGRLLRQRKRALSAGIDVTVLRRSRAMSRTMLGYAPIVGWDTTTVLRYEDYIFSKRALIEAIACAFNWSTDEELIGKILAWADVRPEKEEPKAFVRKVTPGDHREKLEPMTIVQLNNKLAKAMELFGYAP